MACLQNQITACATTSQIAETGLSSTSCQKLEELDQCVKEAFKECKEEDAAADFAVLMQALKDMCNPDSDLHEKLSKSSECLGTYFTGLSESPCVQEVKKLTESLKELTLQKIAEFPRKLCAAIPKLLECVYGEVEDICSKDASDVVSALGQPVSNIMSKNCVITDKSDDGVSGADTSALSWALVAAATLLVVVWH